MSQTTLHPVAKTLRLLIDEVAQMFPERRSCIEAIVLAILAKEHVFIFGPPGSGKSALVRAIINAIIGARQFEVLLSKSRPIEIVKGPISLAALRQDKLLHTTEGYMPDVEFAFADELFKMSDTLGHDMLAMLNERRLHQVENGKSYRDIPLSTCFGAGNEVAEGVDAMAAWDRMLVRVNVDWIKESSNWISMLDGDIIAATNTVQWSDLKEVIDIDVQAVDIPTDVWQMLVVLKEGMRNKEIFVSDRRWKLCRKLLKASAFLAGRDEATVDNIQVLRHALWDTVDQISTVERLTLAVSNPTAEKALGQLELAEQIAQEIRDAKGQSAEKRAALSVQVNGQIGVIQRELNSILTIANKEGASTTKVQEVLDRVAAIQRSVFIDLQNVDASVLASLGM